ncbi:hypothetical protein FW774_15555 [Pedobacter sp. BS3]|uniref:hypothetical protein n=1 Tax=Pedobacter sp. BS3 TaxID=2567937 RepID=UPI0011EBEF50|nr:hypothetical protein [Pedobacter sp. BS3]TZF82107.1 hypothetical protein FW774_15555 [Pedobacter sp. BS3]
MTRKIRYIVFAVAILVLLLTLYQQAYELSAVVALAMLFLAWSHYRQGTVALAARAYHQQDFDKAESLLKEIQNPDRLSRNRRGFYEFMLGGIALKRDEYDTAERHFQIASRFPLRNQNDKALILVQLANLALRRKEYERVRAYIQKAGELKISARVQHIIQKIEKEIPAS